MSRTVRYPESSASVFAINARLRPTSPAKYASSAGIWVAKLCDREVRATPRSHPKTRVDCKGPSSGHESRILLCFQVIFLTPLRQLPLLRPDWLRLDAAPIRPAAAVTLRSRQCEPPGSCDRLRSRRQVGPILGTGSSCACFTPIERYTTNVALGNRMRPQLTCTVVCAIITVQIEAGDCGRTPRSLSTLEASRGSAKSPEAGMTSNPVCLRAHRNGFH
jgi:hypothetical protein